jgi:hypothetical protein
LVKSDPEVKEMQESISKLEDVCQQIEEFKVGRLTKVKGKPKKIEFENKIEENPRTLKCKQISKRVIKSFSGEIKKCILSSS